MGGQIKFYYDLMSQPSRALYILFKLNKVPFEDNPVALRNGAHLTPEFKDINRFQKVPCIVEDGFKLAESIAILRYLQAKGKISDEWYPKEIKSRARTDEYLEWQHNNTRMACAMYFQKKWLRPMISGKQPDPKTIDKAKELMENCLDAIENIWLADNKFLTGNKINVADLFGACEVEQIRIAGYNPGEGRPKLHAWLNAVRDSANPYYTEAHKFVDKLAQNPSKL
ncbi:unnamed protein product [Hermetia illucens]|uniref:glutathione transferase n=1 Tax=Hermetia illucens TaxID=343691 RepID=A0A7R8V2B5_HERIL|nr:glutathione S-transferase theta-3-like [Hermetia illucens]CAD7090807.1 unnamed protein product [Hermetia illucens]